MNRIMTRTARKRHICESCSLYIGIGDRYLEHIISPHHDDVGNMTWWRAAECGDCAIRYGRVGLLGPEPHHAYLKTLSSQ